MARRCELSGKAVLTGNNVSHAKRRTKRRFLPNLCNVTLESEALKKRVRLTISAHALRSVEHRGGLDAYLLKAGDDELSLKARRLKREIAKRHEAQASPNSRRLYLSYLPLAGRPGKGRRRGGASDFVARPPARRNAEPALPITGGGMEAVASPRIPNALLS